MIIMASLSRIPKLRSQWGLLDLPTARNVRHLSVLNRPPPNYKGHVPLTLIERSALAVGSAVTSLFNPRRAGLCSID